MFYGLSRLNESGCSLQSPFVHDPLLRGDTIVFASRLSFLLQIVIQQEKVLFIAVQHELILFSEFNRNRKYWNDRC